MLDWRDDWPRCRYHMSREALVNEAREWQGTPFHWQQATKHKGCDCKGLIVGIAREAGRPEAHSLEALMMGDYVGRVPVARLRLGLMRLFDKADKPQPGDILLIKVGGIAQHLAMYLGEGRMIHCYAKGPGKVVEVPMGHVWWSAVDSVWSWRD